MLFETGIPARRSKTWQETVLGKNSDVCIVEAVKDER